MAAVAILNVVPRVAVSAVLHVPADLPTITAAVAAAGAADTVEIACGTYFEHGISFHGAFLFLRGASGDPTCVVIDGGGTSSVLGLDLTSGGNAFVEGITFRGATGFALQAPWSPSHPPGYLLTISNCAFRSNGGGVSSGIAVYMDHCVLLENSPMEGFRVATTDFRASASATVNDCEFSHNASGIGLAAHEGNVDATIAGTIFHQNSVWTLHAEGSLLRGRARALMRACTIVDDPGMHLDTADLTIDHSILAAGSGVVACGQPPIGLQVYCTDIYGHPSGDWTGCLAPFQNMGGNFSGDPLFCDAPHEDFRLQGNSPCSAGVNTTCLLIGARDVGCGVVPVESLTWGRMKTLFR